MLTNCFDSQFCPQRGTFMEKIHEPARSRLNTEQKRERQDRVAEKKK